MTLSQKTVMLSTTSTIIFSVFFFFFQAEDGIRDGTPDPDHSGADGTESAPYSGGARVGRGAESTTCASACGAWRHHASCAWWSGSRTTLPELAGRAAPRKHDGRTQRFRGARAQLSDVRRRLRGNDLHCRDVCGRTEPGGRRLGIRAGRAEISVVAQGGDSIVQACVVAADGRTAGCGTRAARPHRERVSAVGRSGART